MASNVEERVVALRFDDKDFERNAERSLNTLDKLDRELQFKGGVHGFEQIESAISKVADRMSTFGIIGATVLSNLTNSVISFSKNLLLAIPRQMIQGGQTRALNIESAKFQLSGLGILWEDIYDNIDKAVAGTAYGLDEAAKVAAQLAASGVAYGDAQSDMAHALRGISGVAAMTNSSYEDIGGIFTTIAGNGKVMSDQLRQLSTRGLNAAAKLGEVLGKSEAEVREMVSKGSIDFVTFANAMDEAFGEHATKANETFTGAFSNMKAALSRIGADFATPTLNAMRDIYNAARNTFNGLRKQTRPFAENEFTKWIGVISKFGVNVLEKLNFDWVGNLLSDLTGLVNKVNEFFGFSERHTEILTVQLPKAARQIKDFVEVYSGADETWKESASGRRLDALKRFIAGLKNLGGIGVDSVLALGKAFKEVFPGGDKTAFFDKLIMKFGSIGDKIGEIRENLKNSETISKIFKPMFQIFSRIGQSFKAIESSDISRFLSGLKSLGGIGVDALKAFGKAFSDAFPDFGNTDIFAKMAKGLGNLGDAFTNIRTWLKDKNVFATVFTTTFTAINKIKSVIQTVSSWFSSFIKTIFQLDDTTSIWSKLVEWISAAIKPLSTLWENAKAVFESLGGWRGVLTAVGEKISDIWGNLSGFLSDMKDKIGGIFSGQGTGEKIFELAGGLAALTLSGRGLMTFSRKLSVIKGYWKNSIFDTWKDLKALPGKIGGAFGQLTASLREMGNEVKTKEIKNIAISVLILAAALAILAAIDGKALSKSLAAAAAGLSGLIGAMALVEKIPSGAFSGIKYNNLKKLAVSLLIISVAIVVLTKAVKELSTLSWEELARGVVGVVALMAAIAGMSHILNGKNFKTKVGVGLVLMAAAILILVTAVKQLADIKDGMERATLAVMGLMLMMGILSALTNSKKVNVRSGLGLVLMAASILILVKAVEQLGELDKSGALNSGMIGLGALMALIAGLFLVLNQVKAGKMLAISVAMIAFGAAVRLFVSSITALSKLDKLWGPIAAVGAFVLMFAVLAGIAEANAAGMIIASVAFLVMAAALIPFAGAMMLLGQLEWSQILKALAAIAGVFLIVGVAAALLAPIIVVVLALAGALLLFSAAVYVAGAALVILAAGFVAIATAGAAGVSGFVLMLTAFAEGLVAVTSTLANAIVLFITTFLVTLAGSTDVIVAALASMLVSVIESLSTAIPVILENFVSLLLGIGDVIIEHAPELIEKILLGLEVLLTSLANSMSNHQGIFTAIGDIINVLIASLMDILIGGVDTMIASTTELFTTIGGSIGSIVGSIAGEIFGAFLEGLSEHFTSIADNFGAFIDELTPIADKVNGLNLDPAAVTALEGIATVILTLTEASLIDGISRIASFLTGGTDFKKFGDELAELGPGVAAYGEAVKDVDSEAITASVEAINAIVDIAGKLEKHGGLWQSIVGETESIGAFAVKLVNAAPNLEKFGERAPNIAAHKDDILKVAEVIDALVQVANSIQPSETEILWGAYKTSTNDLADFAAALGDKVTEDGTVVKGLSSCLVDFAKASQEIKDYDTSAIIEVIEKLAEVGTLVSEATQSETWAWGLHTEESGSLGDMITSLTDTGESLKSFASLFTNSDVRKLNILGDAIKKFAEVEQMAGTIADDGSSISDMAWYMWDSFASIKNAEEEIADVDWATLDDAFAKMKEYNLSLSSFSEWGDSAITSMTDAMTEKAAVSAVQTASNVARTISSAISTMKVYFYSAGSNSAKGYIDGFLSKLTYAANAGTQLTETMIISLRRALRIESPSKVMMQLGSYSGEGFAMGLESWTGKLETVSEGVAGSVVDPLEKALSAAAKVFVDDTADDFVIRPVLDLSDIENGARSVGAMFNSRPTLMPSLMVDQMQSSKDEIAELLDVGWMILKEIQNGSDLYLDDKVLAGRINRRLGRV